jgi:polyisoprenyl-phosphate glycosyltransferase
MDSSRGPSSAFLSVVVAEQDAAGTLPDWLRALSARLQASFPNHEILVVDAGSTDRMAQRVQELLPHVPNIHLFRLSGITERSVATTAGLDQCIGDIVVTPDHLFDTPEVVESAAERVLAGYDVVYGVDETRHGRLERPFRALARGFTWFFRRSTGIRLPVLETGVRAVSRRALNAWLSNEDRSRLVRVMPALSGHDFCVFRYRGAGARAPSRPSVSHWLRVGMQTIMAATVVPVRVATALAVIASFINLLYSGYVVAVAALKGDVVEGWTSLSLQMAGMFFLFSIILAIISEYVFQIAQRTHSRPLYRVIEEASSPSFTIKERLNVVEGSPEVPEAPRGDAQWGSVDVSTRA